MIIILSQNINDVESLSKVRKGKFGPLRFIWVNIPETVLVMTNVCVKHILKSWIINGESHDQIVYETHIVSYI